MYISIHLIILFQQVLTFTGYVQGGFDMYEQVRLRDLCDKLDKEGVKFLLSNSATLFIEDLYKDYKISYVKANRSINSNAKKEEK